MEILVAVLAGALLASLLSLIGAAAMLRYVRGELAAERQAREQAQLAGLRALEHAESRNAELRAAAAHDEREERRELLERIQRPEITPYVDDGEESPFVVDQEEDEVRRSRAEREARAAQIDEHLAETFGRAAEAGL